MDQEQEGRKSQLRCPPQISRHHLSSATWHHCQRDRHQQPKNISPRRRRTQMWRPQPHNPLCHCQQRRNLKRWHANGSFPNNRQGIQQGFSSAQRGHGSCKRDWRARDKSASTSSRRPHHPGHRIVLSHQHIAFCRCWLCHNLLRQPSQHLRPKRHHNHGITKCYPARVAQGERPLPDSTCPCRPEQQHRHSYCQSPPKQISPCTPTIRGSRQQRL